jgi:hypothetical protein
MDGVVAPSGDRFFQPSYRLFGLVSFVRCYATYYVYMNVHVGIPILVQQMPSRSETASALGGHIWRLQALE